MARKKFGQSVGQLSLFDDLTVDKKQLKENSNEQGNPTNNETSANGQHPYGGEPGARPANGQGNNRSAGRGNASGVRGTEGTDTQQSPTELSGSEQTSDEHAAGNDGVQAGGSAGAGHNSGEVREGSAEENGADGNRYRVRELDSDTLDQSDSSASDFIVPENRTGQAFNFQLRGDNRPRGQKTRIRANLRALETLKGLTAAGTYATAEQQQILSQYTGWGGLADVFDSSNPALSEERDRLRELVGRRTYTDFRISSLTAYYTDPAVTRAIWQALETAGLKEGSTVLEPGCGTGNFLGVAPTGVTPVGIEQEPAAAAIASYLYPLETVQNTSLEYCRFRENSFTAAVGNVPFSDTAPVDPNDNPNNFSTHNYFILKALDAVQIGGYVAMITSTATADSMTSDARRAMIDRADLVTAVRLPKQAFRASGTDVLTDLLIFRKRAPEEEPSPNSLLFEKTDVLEFEDSDAELRANGFFAQNRDHVLGEASVARGRFGQLYVDVSGDVDDLGDQLLAVIEPEIQNAVALGHGQTEPTEIDPLADMSNIFETPEELFGSVRVNGEDTNGRPIIEQLSPLNGWNPASSSVVPNARKVETAHLIRIYDLSINLQEAYIQQADPEIIQTLQTQVENEYDTYVALYGPILRSQVPKASKPNKAERRRIYEELANEWRIDHYVDATEPLPDDVDKQFKEEAAKPRVPDQREQPHLKLFFSTPHGISAFNNLEEYNPETEQASKRDFFYRNPARTVRELTYTHSIDRALRESLVHFQAVDVNYIAQIMDEQPEWVATQLTENRLAFRDPEKPDTFIQARDYLSGQVFQKLDTAERAASVDERFRVNVEALSAVLPPRVENVDFQLGATWIPLAMYKDFVADTFYLRRDTVERRVKIQFLKDKGWSVEYDSDYWDYGGQADRKFGVIAANNPNGYGYNFRSSDRDEAEVVNQAIGCRRNDGVARTALDIFKSGLNMASPRLNHSTEWMERHPGSTRLHEEATNFARLKVEDLNREFVAWINANPERRQFLVDRYNQLFNQRVAPVWDGSQRQFEGLSDTYDPYSYQANAVERIVNEPSVLLNHAVGAGKSGTMFMAAMELKKSGLAQQPWIVMPNQVAEQMGREIKQWYPTARVLSGYGLKNPQERAQFIMQSIAGEWDLVLCPQSVFEKIPMSKEARSKALDEQITELEEELEDAKENGAEITARDINRAAKILKDKFAKLMLEESDPNHEFEATRCDYLFVDEAHNYKNLYRYSSISEINHPGSNRALNLDLKLKYLRQSKPAMAPVVTFATGTPVSNNIAELWVMAHYLRPDLLEESHISTVQEWAANFTSTVESIETSASGNDLRTIVRVGAYKNAPELAMLTSMFMDVVASDQIEAERPDVENFTIEFDPGDEVRDFIADLAEREKTKWGPAGPKIDPAIKYRGDGKKVTLHPPLANLRVEGYGPRVEALAEQIYRIWQENKDNVYTSQRDGEESPIRGALQLVFADKGVNQTAYGSAGVYADLRACLAAKGMEFKRIRIIGEWDDRKDALFQDCREGHVDVLIGSTDKLGTGVNIQDRAIALHHLDVPNRPSDLSQREGRIVRQNNQNDSVAIYRYVAAGTFDQNDWQMIERKARFIEQIYAADMQVRNLDLEVPTQAEAAAQLRAMATGNQVFVDYVRVKKQMDDLRAQHTAWKSAFDSQRYRIDHNQKTIARLTTAIERAQPLIPVVDAWQKIEAKDRVYRTRDGKELDRAAAADHALQTIRDMLVRRQTEPQALLEIAGIQLNCRYNVAQGAVNIYLNNFAPTEGSAAKIDFTDLSRMIPTGGGTGQDTLAVSKYGVMTRVENVLKGLPKAVEKQQATIERAQRDLDTVDSSIGTEFPLKDELEKGKYRLAELEQQKRQIEFSDEMLIQKRAREIRMEQYGREPLWTLMRNPTPELAESRHTTQDQMVWEELHKENQAMLEHGLIDDEKFAKLERQIGISPEQRRQQAQDDLKKAQDEAQKHREQQKRAETEREATQKEADDFNNGRSLSDLVNGGTDPGTRLDEASNQQSAEAAKKRKEADEEQQRKRSNGDDHNSNGHCM